MPPFAYAPVFLFPLVAYAGLVFGGWWAAALPVIAFGLVPVLELVLPPNRVNLDEAAEARARQARIYDWMLYAFVPIQVGVVVLLAARADAMGPFELAGAVLTAGICCGTFGINVAHELGHRESRAERAMAKVLLATSLYVHFFIEHNRGHHARVATDEDPASARPGESVHAFWLRSVTGGWRSAWAIEARRLKGAVWTPRNEMLRLQVFQVAVVAAVFVAFGPTGGLAFVAAGVVGLLLLETVNYIEHYGLRRERLPGGRFERVRPAHSWNSDHPLGRVLLFELTRHSDHHAHARRPYQVLRHFDDAPQLPAGYPAMILLALLPPAWFRVMDPHVRRELARLAT